MSRSCGVFDPPHEPSWSQWLLTFKASHASQSPATSCVLQGRGLVSSPVGWNLAFKEVELKTNEIGATQTCHAVALQEKSSQDQYYQCYVRDSPSIAVLESISPPLNSGITLLITGIIIKQNVWIINDLAALTALNSR